jgi:hypothetical protein
MFESEYQPQFRSIEQRVVEPESFHNKDTAIPTAESIHIEGKLKKSKRFVPRRPKLPPLSPEREAQLLSKRVWIPLEYAEFRQIHVNSAARERSLGTGPSYSKRGSSVYYFSEDVLRWLRQSMHSKADRPIISEF